MALRPSCGLLPAWAAFPRKRTLRKTAPLRTLTKPPPGISPASGLEDHHAVGLLRNAAEEGRSRFRPRFLSGIKNDRDGEAVGDAGGQIFGDPPYGVERALVVRDACAVGDAVDETERMLGRASHGLDRVGVRAKHDVEAFRVGAVRCEQGLAALGAVGRFHRPADRAEALGKDFDDAVVAFFVSGLGVDGDQFGHFGRKDAKIERGFRKEDLRGGIRRGEGGDARREGEGGGSGEERSALHGRLLMCGPADSFTTVFSKKHHRSKELPDKTDGPSLQRTAAGGGTFSRDRDIPSARRRLWGRWSSDRDSDRTK